VLATLDQASLGEATEVGWEPILVKRHLRKLDGPRTTGSQQEVWRQTATGGEDQCEIAASRTNDLVHERDWRRMERTSADPYDIAIPDQTPHFGELHDFSSHHGFPLEQQWIVDSG